MSPGLRVEVHVRGCLVGDLLAMVQALEPAVVRRHTALTVGRDEAGHDLLALLHALERAGIDVECVLS